MQTMQRPSGGCGNCGGPVRTPKGEWGWTCARCVRELEARASSTGETDRESAGHRYFY